MTTTTDLSLGEFRILVAKAFRGAGYSWGLTEDGSFAAKRLAEFGVPAADLVIALLTAVDGRDPVSLMPADPADSAVEANDTVCPVCLGVSVADTGTTIAESGASVANVVAPAFVAPLLATSLEPGDGATYVVEWSGGQCEASENSIVMSGSHPEGAVEVKISTHEKSLGPVPRHDRVILSAPVLELLKAFAHRTYAPATEASRIAGAGPS